jgi:hypothetical protein
MFLFIAFTKVLGMLQCFLESFGQEHKFEIYIYIYIYEKSFSKAHVKVFYFIVLCN